MTERSFADVFISYVEEDSAVALEIAEGLQAAGYSTWCYEVDNIPGVARLTQTSRAVEEARAVIVLISPHSLGSHDITREVVRAHETEKPFIPVLVSISHVEYTTRQPEWREAIGAATTIQVPAGGVGLIIPRIRGGLKALGIEASGEGTEPAKRAGAVTQPLAPAAPARSGKKKIAVGAAVAVGVVAVATGALALRGGDGADESAATGKTTRPADAATATTKPAEDEVLDSATTPVEMSRGPARVVDARLSPEFCDVLIPEDPFPCQVAPAGSQFLIIELTAWSEDDVLLFDIADGIGMEAFQSYVVFEGTRVDPTTLNTSLDPNTGQQIPTGIRVAYAPVPLSAAGQSVDLYWPGTPPVRVPLSV